MTDTTGNRIIIFFLFLCLAFVLWGLKQHGNNLENQLKASQEKLKSTEHNLETVVKEKKIYEAAYDEAMKEKERISHENRERSKNTDEVLRKHDVWSSTLVPDDILSQLRSKN